MSKILKYLPTPSDYANKVAKAVTAYEKDIYAVGGAARKTVYGFKTSPKDYDFVLSRDPYFEGSLKEDFESEFPGKVKSGAWGSPNALEIDCESFILKIRVQPIDQFLREVRFAGDAMAVSLADDRPICMPEFMSLPPSIAIIKTEETDAQNDKEWVAKHIETLVAFQKELFEMVNGEIDNPKNELIDAPGN